MTCIHDRHPRWRTLESVDPGVDYYATAWFREGVLTGARILEIDCKIDFHNLVIERAHIRRESGKKRVRDTDVENLLLSTGRLIDRAAEVYRVRPSQWKGSADKSAHHKHLILPALTPGETALLAGRTKGELEHILDAVGIGLQHLGRIP